jgi:hypothetical protein
MELQRSEATAGRVSHEKNSQVQKLLIRYIRSEVFTAVTMNMCVVSFLCEPTYTAPHPRNGILHVNSVSALCDDLAVL